MMAGRSVIASIGVIYLQMKFVESYSTSRIEKEVKKERRVKIMLVKSLVFE